MDAGRGLHGICPHIGGASSKSVPEYISGMLMNYSSNMMFNIRCHWLKIGGMLFKSGPVSSAVILNQVTSHVCNLTVYVTADIHLLVFPITFHMWRFSSKIYFFCHLSP